MNFDHFKEQVERKRIQALENISNVPVSTLIWGPNPTSLTVTANIRKSLKEELSNKGHYAKYSEELFDPLSHHSNFAQQVAQAEAFDIIFSIPDSPGSIAEIHDFARIPYISNKIITFIDRQWNDGYSNQALISLESNISCRIQIYDQVNMHDFIMAQAIKYVKTLQETYFIFGRR